VAAGRGRRPVRNPKSAFIAMFDEYDGGHRHRAGRDGQDDDPTTSTS